MEVILSGERTQLIWVWDACQAMCPVFPRVQSVRRTARDELVGTTGVLGGAIFSGNSG